MVLDTRIIIVNKEEISPVDLVVPSKGVENYKNLVKNFRVLLDNDVTEILVDIKVFLEDTLKVKLGSLVPRTNYVD